MKHDESLSALIETTQQRTPQQYAPRRWYDATSISTAALGAAGLAMIIPVTQGITALYNGAASVYNCIAASAGMDSMLMQYASNRFSASVAGWSATAAVAAMVLNVATTIYSDSKDLGDERGNRE